MTVQIYTPPYSSFNRYFMIPFLVWVVGGGIALLVYDKQILFATFNTHHTSFLDAAMNVATKMGEGVFGAIILLLLLGLKHFRNWWYFSAALLCNILPALLTQGVKSFINAPRPLTYFNKADWVHINEDWPHWYFRSFPSGHTCAAFCLFGFLACMLTPKNKWLGILFFLLAMMVGYSRMYLAAHFFLDVYVGSIFGVVFTLIILAIMRKYPHYFYRRKQPADKASQ